MSDRTLLELAAKAAGIKLHVWGTRGAENFADMDAAPYGKLWNPLTDDGDALRLAVKLGLTMNLYGNAVFVSSGEDLTTQMQRFADDRYAATRRAIVCFAAEIGKAMP